MWLKATNPGCLAGFLCAAVSALYSFRCVYGKPGQVIISPHIHEELPVSRFQTDDGKESYSGWHGIVWGCHWFFSRIVAGPWLCFRWCCLLGAVGKEVSFAQTYREGDIWFGVLFSDYVINASTTLSLAFKSSTSGLYSAVKPVWLRTEQFS